MMQDEMVAYDVGDPKRSDYQAPATCVLCNASPGKHYTDCMQMEATC